MIMQRKVGMRGAAVIQFASKYTSLFVQLFITAILARLLPPEDFGTLAIILVFLNLFIPFADMGIGAAIIQYQDLDDRDYGALFSFSILFALALTVLFCAASVPIALFFANDQLVPLCCLGSLSLLFATLNMVPNGLLLKDQRFMSIGIRLFVVTVIAGIIAIIMAFSGWGVYALIWHNIIAGAITFLWNYFARPIRHLTVRFVASLKKVFSYSVFQFGSSMVNYFSTNLPNLVIGKVFGEAPLGFYDKAYRLTTYPLNGISNVIISVIQPYMAKHQDDLETIFSYWFKVAKALSLVGIPIAAIFFCAPEEIVGIMYGDQWGSAVILLQMLAVSIYFQLVNSVAGAFFLSAGRADLLFRSVTISTLLTVGGLVVGIFFGSLQAVALCLSVAFCLHTVPTAYYFLKRTVRQGYRCIARFLPEICIGLIAGGVCMLLAPFFPKGIVLSFICKTIVILAIVGIGYAIAKQYGYIKEVLRSR